jgi:hypothetical protein
MTSHQASAVLFRPLDSSQAANVTLKILPQEQLSSLMSYNQSHNIVMTASTPQNAVGVIVPAHVYTVLSISADNKVTLRNPWGHNGPSPKYPNLTKPGETKKGVTDLGNGIISMDLSTFYSYWGVLSYSRLFHT